MSDLTTLASMMVSTILEVAKEHGVVITVLAFFGLISLVSATFDKVGKAFGYLFRIFIAIPLIIVFGLLNKTERKKRLKELGDIKAHLIKKPEKWKSILFYTIFCVLVLVIILVFVKIFWRFIKPILSFNDVTKEMLQNYTMNASA